MVFEKAIQKTTPADEVKQRVINLTDEITYSVFMYTARGLFERDKLIFLAQVAFQVTSGLGALGPRPRGTPRGKVGACRGHFGGAGDAEPWALARTQWLQAHTLTPSMGLRHCWGTPLSSSQGRYPDGSR